MKQDLTRIRAFVQVFDASGFSAAARVHGRSKALLSKYVTDLENNLGVRLMNRSTRKLSLTEAGESYYRDVRGILQQLDDLDATISDQSEEPRGLLRVSVPRNIGETSLAPAIFAFLGEHKDVSIDLRLEDRHVDMVEEGLDVALRISAMPDSSLITRKIAGTSRAVCASPELIKNIGIPVTPEALRGMPCIIDTNRASPSNWRFLVEGKPVTIQVEGRVKVNSPVATLEAALAGLGFAIVPYYVARKAIDAGDLRVVLEEMMPEAPSLQAVYPHRRYLPGKVRTLIDHLIRWYENRPVL